MEIKEVIGIDASKLTLDCCIHNNGSQEVFGNTLEDIPTMAEWSLDISGVGKQELLFVFEHTGLYTHQLIQYLGGEGYLFYVVPGLEIKRSLGIARGKDDRADAKRIAQYGYRLRDEVKPYRMPGDALAGLKRLISMRRKLVAQRAGHIATLGEQQRVLDGESGKVLFHVQQEVINTLDLQISVLEKEMDKIIDGDPELKRLFRLLTGIKGIGAVTARFLIVYTVGFTAFGTWRKFASYCGIAPFPNRSGTSIRGRTKVSHLANKEGKVLLNLCAMTAIQCSPEMRVFYKRRLKEGKNEMSTLNIVRNKLLARAFAVVNRGTPYVDIMGYAA
jgi:transposase